MLTVTNIREINAREVPSDMTLLPLKFRALVILNFQGKRLLLRIIMFHVLQHLISESLFLVVADRGNSLTLFHRLLDISRDIDHTH